MDNRDFARLCQSFMDYHVVYLDEEGKPAETLSADAPQEAWEAFQRANEYMLSPNYVPIR